jgi:RNA polymerase sigma factor (sigma-70 family)
MWSTIMVARDIGTQQQEDARQRYEMARERLTGELGSRVSALVGVSPQAIVPADATYDQRAAVIESGLELIVPLRRFVEGELQGWVDPEVMATRAIEVDDIMADVYLEAVEQADSAPVARAFYTWLRRIARRQVRNAVLALDERAERERSIYLTVPVSDTDADDEWPDDVNQLIDMLADPNAVKPEDLLERVELQAAIARVLLRLPEQWREIYLMNVVDGWNQEDISTAEGIDSAEVDWKIRMTREFLRSWIEEAREDRLM